MCTSRARSRSRRAACALLAGTAAFIGVPSLVHANDAEELSRLRTEIEAISASNRRCHNVVQCRVISMGFDDCGRPTYHVAYNDITGAGAALESKASEYTFVEEESHRGRLRPAECAPRERPKPVCHRNQCTAGGRND